MSGDAEVRGTWAVLPVAGSGSRLRPHTHTRPKPLLCVAGRPILGHILDRLTDSGIAKVVLVVGQMGDQIVEYVERNHSFEQVRSVEQEERLGLGHAVLLTRPVVQDDPVLIVYGDTIFQADLLPVLASPLDDMLGVMQVADPRRFGVVVERDGRVVRLVEKPEAFVSDQAIVGVNFVRASRLLFDCLERLVAEGRRTRGEFQLTDGLQEMVQRGGRLGTFQVEEWFDCGTQEALLETNRRLLENAPPPDHLENAVIVPPVYVDPTACVEASVLGPNVSIGEGARVKRVIGRNMIVGAQALVENIVLEDSLIGFRAVVRGRSSRLNVGDLSEITE